MTGKEFSILMSPHRVLHWMQVFSCSQVSGNCAHLTYRVVEVCSARVSTFVIPMNIEEGTIDMNMQSSQP